MTKEAEVSAKTRDAIDVDELVAQSDTGARTPQGSVALLMASIAFCWSLFQLYIASNVPFYLTQTFGVNLVFNGQESRIIHLAFGMALATLAYPLFKSSPRKYIPIYDWVLLIVAVTSCLYLVINKNAIADRAGLPTTADLVISTIGMISIALAVFRSLGLPMLIVAGVFVMYVFFGDARWLPDVVQWKGASYGKAMWHYWMQTEGVFGVALGVSASMIFLFVLFGALLERAGAGNYFIKLAFALLGHLRGGPAKASVVASALSGLYSGSSIANTVTTGTFTIPLMKRTGFSPEKAGAVEVASSTNGQLTPPVMGAAAFLIAEFTGLAYTDIIKHAIVPALISYIALVYIVHLEALKLGLKGMEKPPSHVTALRKLSGVLLGFILTCALGAAVYYGLGWVKVAFPDMTFMTGIALFLIGYLILIFVAASRPDLEVDDPNAQLLVLPKAGETALTGLHFLLPIVVLLWCILVERLSPALAAFWAVMAMTTVVVTQHMLKSFFRKTLNLKNDIAKGIADFTDGMISGARNMIPIAVATGVAGIIIGTVSLTGAHQIIGEFVELVSGGNLIVMLLLVAVMSLLLGMGLPTTANYIVVSSLMAPVIVSVGAQSGLVVPLIAVHMFVFYFGILADDTPPVGLAAFAAAAISGGDPIKTGLQGFAYDIRTALLPFLFIFNTELLLIDVTWGKAIFVFCIGVVAMMLFAAATQSYFFTKSKVWESIALLLVAFTLFRPGFWLNMVDPPYEERSGTEIIELAEKIPANEDLRLRVVGPDFDKPDEDFGITIQVPLGEAADGATRLSQNGLDITVEDGKALIAEPLAGSRFFETFESIDFYSDRPAYVEVVELEKDRIMKEVFYIPALLLLAFVIMMQRRRQTVPAF